MERRAPYNHGQEVETLYAPREQWPYLTTATRYQQNRQHWEQCLSVWTQSRPRTDGRYAWAVRVKVSKGENRGARWSVSCQTLPTLTPAISMPLLAIPSQAITEPIHAIPSDRMPYHRQVKGYHAILCHTIPPPYLGGVATPVPPQWSY